MLSMLLEKKKSAYEPSGMKRLGIFLLPLDGMLVFIFCYTFYFTFLLAMIVELLPTLITLGTKITLKCPDQGMHEWNVLPVSTRNSTSLDLF